MEQTREEKEAFVKGNLGLIHACAHRFQGRGIEYDDLFGAGSIGLVKAIDAFDENRGVRFSTYAVPVILGEMRRLFRDGGAIKVSRSLKELSLKLTREREQFAAVHFREPTVQELAVRLDTDPELVVEALGVSQPPVSLTEDPEEGGGQFDIRVDAPEEELADKIALREVINRLEGEDRNLITLRYFGNKTQVETAKLLGMTQVQVSRREKKILLLLRERLSS